MTLSWNSQVNLYPNNRGWEIFDSWYRARDLPVPSHAVPIKMTLWEAANVFGEYLYNGCDMPFENTLIEVIR